MKKNTVLGVDIGGTGIKGGLIDMETGQMISERHRIATPQPATPEAVAATFAELVAHFEWDGPIGVGFPAIVHHGKAMSAANIDPSWVGTHIEKLLSKAADCPVHVLNDADAAGIAVMRYGVGKGKAGVVIMLTIGTGIGSAMFIDSRLIPNTEFGHLYLKGQEEVAEKYTSGSARKRLGLDWKEWGKRFNTYLHHLDRLFSPDLIILGGGGSKHWESYKPVIDVDFPVMPAGLLNKAGSVGAAYYAWALEKGKKKKKKK